MKAHDFKLALSSPKRAAKPQRTNRALAPEGSFLGQSPVTRVYGRNPRTGTIADAPLALFLCERSIGLQHPFAPECPESSKRRGT